MCVILRVNGRYLDPIHFGREKKVLIPYIVTRLF